MVEGLLSYLPINRRLAFAEAGGIFHIRFYRFLDHHPRLVLDIELVFFRLLTK